METIMPQGIDVATAACSTAMRRRYGLRESCTWCKWTVPGCTGWPSHAAAPKYSYSCVGNRIILMPGIESLSQDEEIDARERSPTRVDRPASRKSAGTSMGDAEQVLEIAIVDDDVCVRESMVGLIESIGYDVRFFASAEELLGSPCLDRVGCLILDVLLPEMSGIQLYFRLRGQNRHIPTIFMTAHVDGTARTQAMEAGAVAFLYKPFRIDALLDAVKIAIGRS
jgi:CheY-like chemotaxis protein